ncbi:NAD(P)/FAD-dependent oxidoreductase [Streptomyces sp. MZ04]|uniref:FAD-dependent oxidoreductase n=1 Tax=Streptomyces sp. MZ04 TaxID=2559236 RepID=UPI00107EBA25|nr:NAD(P)/FAD-dependent oxidoreductase [Streptomyces sp. MZ04]TGB00982.1 FAD-dependent monooxygenase [Streptomyces sp. MZ04]
MTVRNPARVRTALVIGGGIAGPVAAMALRKAGIEATVYEAYDPSNDASKRQAGPSTGLTIAPNGQQALSAIDAADVVNTIGTPLTATTLHSWTGKDLASLDAPTDLPPDLPPTRFVWRTDLHEAMAEEATRREIPIHRGKRLLDATDTGTGISARFADGSLAKADILIGADGLRSTVRRLIDASAPTPHYAGTLTFTARTEKAAAELPPTPGVLHHCLGKRAYLTYQTFEDGSAVWSATLPHREPMTKTEAQSVGSATWLTRLREAFADDRTPATELLRATHPSALLITGPTENMPSVPTWTRGRMALIGDAAHATPPTSGQGASLASESAVELARCLRDLPHSKAFRAYESLRRPRVDRILKHATTTPTATSAAARTASPKPAGPLTRALRDAVLPVAMKVGGGGSMWGTWQYEHRIDWEARVDY